MPDEPQEIKNQPSNTPHFDEFSGHENTESTQFEPIKEDKLPIEPMIASIKVSNTVQPSAGFMASLSEATDKPAEMQQPNQVPGSNSALGSGSAADLAPAPTVNPVSFANNMRISDSTISQQPIQITEPSSPSKFSKKKKLIIGLIVALLVVVIGGGSAFAYVSWYQNPQKVLVDAVINMVTAKTSVYNSNLTINVDDGSAKANLVIDAVAKQAKTTGSLDVDFKFVYSGNTYSLKSSGLYDDKGDIYVKASELKPIMAELYNLFPMDQTISESVDKFIDKIDGQWIRISSDDTKAYSQEYSKTQKCINIAITEFEKNKSDIKLITDQYQKSPFIVIDKELGIKDGNFGYQLSTDFSASKDFIIGLKATKLYKDLVACDSNYDISDNDIKSVKEPSTNNYATIVSTIWISVWGHQITKFETNVTGIDEFINNSAIFTIEPIFNEKVEIVTPESSISLTELQSYLKELYGFTDSGYSINDYSI